MKIAGVLLRLPDTSLVLQRRDNRAPASPNLLGFFGGKIEPGESAEAAALRELSEETTIDVKGMKLEFIAKFKIPELEPDHGQPKFFSLFSAHIENADFEVLEGIGLEIYHQGELAKRDDLTPSVRYSLENLLEDK
jgi:8-oxo-dGTP pyrophosphatase MutT (NUDIX family)